MHHRAARYRGRMIVSVLLLNVVQLRQVQPHCLHKAYMKLSPQDS